jgi:hypothetical protein
MGTWIKCPPPKMLHDKLGIYHGQWHPEMDRCWMRKEDGVTVCSRLIRTKWGNVEHVTITKHNKDGLPTADGSGDLTWAEKYEIKNELFGENRAAVEVFPKADKLVDSCDVYHLWVFDKKFEMPFGIHPKEYTKAVNRGYSITTDDVTAFSEAYNALNQSEQ